MDNRWMERWLVWLVGGLVALLSPLAVAGAEPTGAVGYEVARLIEIRPAGGQVVGPGAEVMAEALVEKIQSVPQVTRVEKYLFVGVVDRAQQPPLSPLSIIAGTFPEATLRVNCHNVEKVQLVQGRHFTPGDAGQRVAVVRKAYAEKYAPAGAKPLAVGASIRLVAPTMETGGVKPALEEATVRVIGVFDSGFRLGDNQVLLPLDTAQKLFGLEGKVSKIKAVPTRLLSLGAAELQRLLAAHPAYSRHVIAAGTYPDADHEILTVARKNALVSHQNLDAELVYQIIRAILEHPDEFQQVCPLAIAYTSKNILPGSSLIPLHAGAKRYLQGQGVL